jgi:hypothetical protein
LVLDTDEWSTSCPASIYDHERTPVPTEMEAMQDPELVWMVVKKIISLASVKIQTQNAQFLY